MNKLEELRDYLCHEIGNLVTVIYDRATGCYSKDRIRIKYDGCWVGSIYNGASDGFFDIIFYDPFTCRWRGYLPFVSLIARDIPLTIKNRINIREEEKMSRIDVNINTNNDTLAKQVFMISSRGSGKTRYVSDLLKNKTVVYNGNIYTNIENVIFNDPATIVLWTDGSKTVVKCQPGETFDPEKGLAMAISKKVLGNDYGYYEIFAKHVGRYNKKRGKKDGPDRQTT